MDETIIPYELPEAEDHSFFFVDVQIAPRWRPSCTSMMLGNCTV